MYRITAWNKTGERKTVIYRKTASEATDAMQKMYDDFNNVQVSTDGWTNFFAELSDVRP